MQCSVASDNGLEPVSTLAAPCKEVGLAENWGISPNSTHLFGEFS